MPRRGDRSRAGYVFNAFHPERTARKRLRASSGAVGGALQPPCCSNDRRTGRMRARSLGFDRRLAGCVLYR